MLSYYYVIDFDILIVSIAVHIRPCALNMYCRCHKVMGGVFYLSFLKKAEIKKEVKERQEWQQLVLECTRWSSDSEIG